MSSEVKATFSEIYYGILIIDLLLIVLLICNVLIRYDASFVETVLANLLTALMTILVLYVKIKFVFWLIKEKPIRGEIKC